MDQLRIGIVGTGFVAAFHARGFRNQPDAAIAGFAGDPARAAALAVEHGGRAYPGFEAMVEDRAVDALVIASVNRAHAPQALHALGLGKPVLVEKPVAGDIGQLCRLGDAARRAGTIVFPGHNFLYRGAVREARAALDAGRIGKVLHASFVSAHTISPAHAGGWRGRLGDAGGGALMDSGHHQVYQSLFLRGRPAMVHAFTSRQVLTGMEGEDLAQVSLQYPDGTTGVILQSWAGGHGGRLDGINLLGTAGDLVVSDRLYLSGSPGSADTGYAESFAGQARAFIDAVRGRSAPLMDLDGAADALRLIATAYRSAAEGRVLPFPVAAAMAAGA